MTQMDLFPIATSSQQDTHASHFHLPGSAEAQKMTDISGHTYFPLFKPSDPLGAFSRMFMGMSLWASTKCYLTWKGKASPQGRSLFQLVPLTHLTDETEFGSSPEMWATPTASSGEPPKKTEGWTWTGLYWINDKGEKKQTRLKDQVAMWPTPRACTAMAAENIHNRVNDKFPNLETVVARTMWLTVTARDYKGGRTPETLAKAGRNETNSLPDAVNAQMGTTGSLNPQWVEWLMGYPEGWTDLED